MPQTVLLTSFIKLALQLLIALPEKLRSLILGWTSSALSRLPHKEIKNLQNNISHVLGLRANSHFGKLFALQVVRNQLQIGFSTLLFWYLRPTATIYGENELMQRINRLAKIGRPPIVVTGHLGCWELAGHFAGKNLPQQFWVLAKPPKIQVFKRMLDMARKKLNMNVLWTSQKTGPLKEMVRQMNRGHALGFVMDQKPPSRLGHNVDFFGRSTTFVRGPANFAIRYNSPILSVYCIKLDNNSFRLRSKIITESAADIDEQKLTQMICDDLEENIRLYPEQWTWNYKRWKFQG